jgi:hypothetical protein
LLFVEVNPMLPAKGGHPKTMDEYDCPFAALCHKKHSFDVLQGCAAHP